MEAVIIVLAALAAIALIDIGYGIAITLLRWSPVIAFGILAALLAQYRGADALEALAMGFVASVAARHVLRPLVLSNISPIWGARRC